MSYNIKKISKKAIVLVLNDIVYIVSYIIPKNKNLWVFGAWLGQAYADNSKYLFEYINKHHPEIRAVWLTKNRDVQKLVKDSGYEAELSNSLRGHWISLRAYICVISHTRFSDLNWYLGAKIITVQLWHGTPLKRIFYDEMPKNNGILGLAKYNKLKQIGKKIRDKLFPLIKEDYSIIISASEEVTERLLSAFRTDIDKIKITGYPRNDALFKYNPFIITDSFNIIYMPTFRGIPNSNFDLFQQFGFDVNKIDTFLKNRGMHLYIKLHPVSNISQSSYNNINTSKNIHFLDVVDIYEILNNFDLLITDYSSIYFDYLILDRPIIFAPFDLEEYWEDRGLYYDYNTITPGPKARNWQDILIFLDDFMRNPHRYKLERHKILSLFNKHIDSNNCKRVFDEIKKIS